MNTCSGNRVQRTRAFRASTNLRLKPPPVVRLRVSWARTGGTNRAARHRIGSVSWCGIWTLHGRRSRYRVVLADPRTVVLDEATALLDPATARNTERALAAVLHGRTVIAIVHRMQTAHDADRIAVMDGGTVTELGTHDELVAAGGTYAALRRFVAPWPVHSPI
jgi:hypothetical protein